MRAGARVGVSRARFVLLGLLAATTIWAASPSRASAYVFWAQGSSGTALTIARADDNGLNVHSNLVGTVDAVGGFVTVGNHVYWAARNGNIGRAKINGSGADRQFIAGPLPPGQHDVPCAGLPQARCSVFAGLAADANYIYTVSGGPGEVIGRISLDGKHVQRHFINLGGTGRTPGGIAVNRSHIYWAWLARGCSQVCVARANLDGTGVDLHFMQVHFSIVSLAADAAHIYWSNGYQGEVGRANVNGTNPDASFVQGVQFAGGLALSNSHIYWTTGLDGAIGRAKLDGTGVNKSFISSASSPYYVAVTKSGPSGTGPSVNHAPVARPEHWTVHPGGTVEGNVLANDHDPDGDPIRAKVVQISFASKEWSGLESGGTFLYTAGPGTARTLHKKITYVAVDSHGARSKPVTSEVTLLVPKSGKPPLPPRVSRAAQLTPSGPTASTAQQLCSRAAPCWYPGGTGSWEDCFGQGVHTQCWVLLSTMETQALNVAIPWLKKPSLSELRQACLPLNPNDITAKNCAQGIAGLEFNHLWNKAIIQTAASYHYCLAFRVARHRTLRHPLAGVWGDPEYDQQHSGITPWQNDSVSGWVYWRKGLTGLIRVPLFCNADGRTWLSWPAALMAG